MKATNNKPKKEKRIIHPSIYQIFKPNAVLKAKKDEMSILQKKLYHEILSFNHKTDPDVLIYNVKYSSVLNTGDIDNLAKNKKRVGRELINKSFFFDNRFMLENFGKDVSSVIVPFTRIDFDDINQSFEVEVNKYFKQILLKLDLGFTKGSIEDVRNFEHSISFEFYWFVRHKQAFHQVFSISFDDLKVFLGLEKKYAVWGNFERDVLANVKEEFMGLWVEFDYKAIKKGRGGKVSEIEFTFKNGPKEEKGFVEEGGFEKWLSCLKVLKVTDDSIKKIRSRISTKSVTLFESGKSIIWDSLYVEESYEIARAQYQKQQKSKNKINNIAGWFVKGLEEGFWLNEVEEKRRELMKASQTELNFN